MINFEDDNEVEKLLKKIDTDIIKLESEKRYKHSLGVMKKAEELAKLYGENINKAKLVGLAHDIGKDLSKEEKLEYVKNNDIEIDEIEKINTGLLHAKIGADICKKKYGFSKDMQNAIKYHTVGNKNMDTFSKIIFIADKIEDGRNYKNEKKMKQLEETRKLANIDLNKALLFLIDSSLEFTLQKKELIHPDSIDTRNRIIMDNK